MGNIREKATCLGIASAVALAGMASTASGATGSLVPLKPSQLIARATSYVSGTMHDDVVFMSFYDQMAMSNQRFEISTSCPAPTFDHGNFPQAGKPEYQLWTVRGLYSRICDPPPSTGATSFEQSSDLLGNGYGGKIPYGFGPALLMAGNAAATSVGVPSSEHGPASRIVVNAPKDGIQTAEVTYRAASAPGVRQLKAIAFYVRDKRETYRRSWS